MAHYMLTGAVNLQDVDVALYSNTCCYATDHCYITHL